MMIRAAIVGIGTWGRNLVEAVQGSELIRFVAGATRTPASAELFCKQHGIRLMESYEDVLAYGELDAVVLATPHSMHCGQIVAAAKAGKHVFVEKPLGVTAKSADDAVAAGAQKRVTLAGGQHLP